MRAIRLRKILTAAVILLCVLALASCGRHVHSFTDWDEIKPPTCAEAGVKKALCKCGEVVEESIAPTGHTPSEAIVVKKPDCEHGGSYKIECVSCGALLGEGEISALGHSIVLREARAATCSSVGYNEHEACENCNYSTRKEIPMVAHTSSGSADCVTAESCVVCGEILRDALGHTEKKVVGRKATCLREGLSDGVNCALCDAVLVRQVAIPKKAHVSVAVSGKSASCTDTGVSAGERCEECGAVTVASIEIPERGHSYSGERDSECDICGFVRAVGAVNCIHENQITVKKAPPTCTKYGLTQGVICEDCGETLVRQEVIAAKGHTEKAVNGYSATCVLPGLSDGAVCADCGAVLKEQEIILPEGHSEITDPFTAPTCRDTGLTEGRHCAACQEVIVKQNTIDSADHVKLFHDGKEPSCTERGWKPYYTCALCSYTSFEQLEKTSHTEVIDTAVAPTCEKSGLGLGKHCLACGLVLQKQEVTAATGHLFGEWQTVAAGGCSDIESAVRVCERCFAVEGKKGAVDHMFIGVCQTVSCTEKRELSIVCERCNADGGSIYIAPLGHDLVWSVTSSGHSQRCYRGECKYSTSEVSHRSNNKAKCEDKICIDCGHLMSVGVGHTLGTRYASDSQYHWNECVNANCSYVENKLTHTNPDAKCTDKNVKCSVCLRYYTRDADHVMSAWYLLTGELMRRDCKNCAYYETKSSG